MLVPSCFFKGSGASDGTNRVLLVLGNGGEDLVLKDVRLPAKSHRPQFVPSHHIIRVSPVTPNSHCRPLAFFP
jgi:hypothetical protein